MSKRGLIFLIALPLLLLSLFLIGPRNAYAGNCDAACTNDGMHNPSCPASRNCNLRCYRNADNTCWGGSWEGDCDCGSDGGGENYYQTAPYDNTYTAGSCSLKITNLAWDDSDGAIGGYKNANSDDVSRRVLVNDSTLTLKEPSNLVFTNNWGASQGRSFSLTTTINSKDAGNTLTAGWRLDSTGCTIGSCTATSEGPFRALTKGNGDCSGSNCPAPVTHNRNLYYCGDGECACGETNSTCAADCAAPTATPTNVPSVTPTPTSIPPTATPTNVPPTNTPTQATRYFRLAETQQGLDAASNQNYTSSPATASFTFTNRLPGVKTLWVRFIDNRGQTRDERATITLVNRACTSVGLRGLTSRGTNSSGGPIFEANPRGENYVIDIDHTPSMDPVSLTVSPSDMTVTSSNPGTGNVYVANVPANTTSSTKSYTLQGTVGPSGSTVSCLPATVQVPPAGPGNCTYPSTEVKFRTGNEVWVTQKTITLGTPVTVAGFHGGDDPVDGNSGSISLRREGPNGESGSVNHNQSFTPTQAGVYLIRATTPGQTGANCQATGTLTVLAVPTATPSPTSVQLSCTSFAPTGLTDTGRTDGSGRKIYSIGDSRGGVARITADRSPAGAVMSGNSTPSLTFNADVGNIGGLVAAIPANNSTTADVDYTVSATIPRNPGAVACTPEFVIRAPKASVDRTCNYNSTEVKFKVGSLWLGQDVSVASGTAINVAGFHNGETPSSPPSDILLRYTGPRGESGSFASNNQSFTPTQNGSYTFTALTTDKTGGACTGSSTFTVTAPTELSCTNFAPVGMNALSEIGDGGRPIFALPDYRAGIRMTRATRSISSAAISPTATKSPASAPDMTFQTASDGTGNQVMNIPENTSTSEDSNYTVGASIAHNSVTASCTPGFIVRVPKKPVDTSCPSDVSSTEARLRVGSGEWSNEGSIGLGTTVSVGGFHNRRVTSQAADVSLTALGPDGPQSREVSLTGNDSQTSFAPTLPGRYTLKAMTTGKTGDRCTGTASLEVAAIAEVTVSYQMAETEAGLAAAPVKQYTNIEGQAPILDEYTFTNKTPGVKTLFVKFTSNKGRTRIVRNTIRLIAPNPVVTSADCRYSLTGQGTDIILRGRNFGDHDAQAGAGKVKMSGADLTIRSWLGGVQPTAVPSTTVTPSPSLTPTVPAATVSPTTIPQPVSMIVAHADTKPSGRIPLELTIDDGRRVTAQCMINNTSVDLTIRSSCKPLIPSVIKDVNVAITEAAAGARPLVSQKLDIDRNGKAPESFAPKLETSVSYVLTAKAPGLLGKKVQFTTADGTTVLPEMVLPSGDIAPAGAPDGAINSLDKAQMVREWNPISDVSRAADLNKDGRINSLDYACLRENIGKGDEVFRP